MRHPTWRGQTLSPKKKKAIAAIFGKLTVTYGAKFRRVEINGYIKREKYTFLAADDETIVIRVHWNDAQKKKFKSSPVFYDLFDFKPRVGVLTFRKIRGKDYFYVDAGGFFFEWFKRID